MITKPKVSINIDFDMKFTESEARAIVAITRYSLKKFLETFYDNLGRGELEENEDGLKLLWSTADKLGSQLKKADELNKMVSDFQNPIEE